MKIIELRAENVKRIKAVEITPDGTLQVIGGRNAQGKSSVLDAIWLALGGGTASKATSRPIRDGEESASITLDLGEIVVTRTWNDKGTKLQVQGADGSAHAAPQRLLDRLLGQLSFDPIAFTRLGAREQRDALLDLVELDVDLDELDAKRARIYDQRTDAGRRDKDLGEVKVDTSLPAEETSARELLAQVREAEDRNREILNARDQRSELAYRIEALEASLIDARGRLADAEEGASRELTDTAELEQSLSAVEETNAAVRANEQAKARKAEKAALKKERDKLTREIEAIDKAKAKALRTAKFPVPGLGFDAHGVTYNDVPFTQAASGEQIRVSVGMGMALNPDLRVMLIKDGSLLDDEAMIALREQVAEQDFQLWIERVGNADESAVIIEDGEVLA